MKIVVFSALGALVAALIFAWAMTRIRYRVGSRHLKVVLFGIRLRRVALDSIESVSKRAGDGWTERWWSTLKPKHRLLIIRRRRGLVRNFAVTPKNRYVFKADLERAMQRVGNRPKPSPDDPLDSQAAEENNQAESST
jgi:hypothetical protein